MKTTGKEDLILKIKAGYCYFYIQTNEILETVEECRTINGNYQTMIWDFDVSNDPEAVLELLRGTERNTVILAKNWNWFLQDGFDFNKTFCSFLQNNSSKFSSREYRKSLVIVSDQQFSKAIPECLQKEFCEVSFPLPSQEEIQAILNNICKTASNSRKFQMPDEKTKDQIVQELKGLTAREIENALSYCLIKHSGEFVLRTLSEIKSVAIERTAGLKLGQYSETFEDLKGYDNLKEFAKLTIDSNLSKGLILLGPAGAGKTMFCKALSNESKKKLIVMEVAELFGGLVGESEKLMKSALDFIRANAPCILMIDEIEKALAGMRGGNNDGGTTKRSLSQLLKFLSDDRPEGVFVVATCNDITSLPPEWVRSERWDGIFFVDLPSEDEQKEILKYYMTKYSVSGKPPLMEGWSGAEIKTLCRLASMMNKSLGDVSSFIVPVSKTMEKEIKSLRAWAKDRTIPASRIKLTESKRQRNINLN